MRPISASHSAITGSGGVGIPSRADASATGHGESIVRVTLARAAVERLRAGQEPTAAAWASVDELAARVHGTAGVILVDAKGRLGFAHNTPTMSFAYGTLGPGEGSVVAGAKAERPKP